MAEAASARREARRRKILENSHNRLQIISGKSANEICKESSNITPIPTEFVDNSVPKESSSVIEHFLNNGVINAGVDSPQSFLSTNHESIALGDGDVTISSHNDEPFISQNSTAPTPESKLTGLTHWEMLTIYSSCNMENSDTEVGQASCGTCGARKLTLRAAEMRDLLKSLHTVVMLSSVGNQYLPHWYC
ncbi:jg7338 [Pararge aegeria aegeria]|uniref:Jg7338 protein n=1 Tax=Pararge aegeria aegeria TaxID=348720 RepID=A0A8S4RJP9_9NEOP|nr:jg7338 [Pararge aegeria aegeria]